MRRKGVKSCSMCWCRESQLFDFPHDKTLPEVSKKNSIDS